METSYSTLRLHRTSHTARPRSLNTVKSSTMRSALLPLTLLAAAAVARDVPSNLASFISSVKSQGQCKNQLASGFWSVDDDSDGGQTSYCGDHANLVYLQGTNGDLSDMDTDCDGIKDDSTGQCDYSNDDDIQYQTSYGYMAHDQWGMDDADLTAEKHSYVVFGNTNDGGSSDHPEFDPSAHGIQPMSVMAVVCNKQLYYGVWADENGPDDDHAMVGEASIALATLCFPDDGISGNNGHSDKDVMYIAFSGDDAVPGQSADWNAGSKEDFEASLAATGDKLVQTIGQSGSKRSVKAFVA